MGVEGLIEQLKTIPDWRRGRTVQYPLWLMLLMSLLGVMSGYSSLRGLEEFRQRHAQEAAELFGLAKAKLPRYSTLRDMADHVDGVAVAQVFLEWAQGNVGVSGGEAISMDGKALGSTVSSSKILSLSSVPVCKRVGVSLVRSAFKMVRVARFLVCGNCSNS